MTQVLKLELSGSRYSLRPVSLNRSMTELQWMAQNARPSVWANAYSCDASRWPKHGWHPATFSFYDDTGGRDRVTLRARAYLWGVQSGPPVPQYLPPRPLELTSEMQFDATMDELRRIAQGGTGYREQVSWLDDEGRERTNYTADGAAEPVGDEPYFGGTFQSSLHKALHGPLPSERPTRGWTECDACDGTGFDRDGTSGGNWEDGKNCHICKGQGGWLYRPDRSEREDGDFL